LTDDVCEYLKEKYPDVRPEIVWAYLDDEDKQTIVGDLAGAKFNMEYEKRTYDALKKGSNITYQLKNKPTIQGFSPSAINLDEASSLCKTDHMVDSLAYVLRGIQA